MIREKEPKVVVSFHTTMAAMAMEDYCRKHGIAGRLIPTPRQVSADCGMSWAAPISDKDDIMQIMTQADIEIASIDELLL